ncbi:hypothetical protein LY89DRAFT_215206, partial [Mollisia scopiformis]
KSSIIARRGEIDGGKKGLARLSCIHSVKILQSKFFCNTRTKQNQNKKHTTAGIRWWSPTQLLICRSDVYGWQSGRDAQVSSAYGRM